MLSPGKEAFLSGLSCSNVPRLHWCQASKGLTVSPVLLPLIRLRQWIYEDKHKKVSVSVAIKQIVLNRAVSVHGCKYDIATYHPSFNFWALHLSLQLLQLLHLFTGPLDGILRDGCCTVWTRLTIEFKILVCILFTAGSIRLSVWIMRSGLANGNKKNK